MTEDRIKSQRFNIFMACLVAIYIFGFASQLHAARAPKLPTLSKSMFTEVIPIVIENEKIYLNATVNGQTFRFVLDSGSPTVITKDVARAVGLEEFGSNTGTDGNGQRVTMSKARVNSLGLGNVEFNDFTALVFDPSNLQVASCMLYGGVIGSDIFPLAAWQINAKNKTLTLSNTSRAFDNIKSAKSVKLLQFGYPYAPIFEYKVGRGFKDKLLFDTGAPVFISLAKPAFQALVKDDAVEGGVVGVGYDGESASLVSEPRERERFSPVSITVGKLKLKDVGGEVRAIAPTVMGAKALHRHIVTLDYPNEKAYFSPIKDVDGKAMNSDRSAPVQFRMEAGKVQVSYLGNGSMSVDQGVQLGHTVWSINGVDVSSVAEEERCEKVRWLLSLKQSPSIEYTLMVDGQQKTIKESL